MVTRSAQIKTCLVLLSYTHTLTQLPAHQDGLLISVSVTVILIQGYVRETETSLPIISHSSQVMLNSIWCGVETCCSDDSHPHYLVQSIIKEENTTQVISSTTTKKDLNVVLHSGIYRLISFKFSMIKTTKLYFDPYEYRMDLYNESCTSIPLYCLAKTLDIKCKFFTKFYTCHAYKQCQHNWLLLCCTASTDFDLA